MLVVLSDALVNRGATLVSLHRACLEAEPREPEPEIEWRHQKRLSETEIAELVAQYLNGKSIYTLARELGVHRHTISSHLKARGVAMRSTARLDLSATEAERLYLAGDSLTKIATRYGVSPTTVLKRLRDHGTPIRSRHG